MGKGSSTAFMKYAIEVWKAGFFRRYVTHAQINALQQFRASGAIRGNHQGISLPAAGDRYSFWHLAYIQHLDILS